MTDQKTEEEKKTHNSVNIIKISVLMLVGAILFLLLITLSVSKFIATTNSTAYQTVNILEDREDDSAKEIENPSNVVPPQVSAVSGISPELNIARAIPEDLKIISNEDNKFIVEGIARYSEDNEWAKYRIGINLSLRPDGKCVDQRYYYNSQTKAEAFGLNSISLDERRAGDFMRYSCEPAEEIEGFIIPIISSEIQEKYPDVDVRVADRAKGASLNAIRNNFFDQIYAIQNPNFSDGVGEYGEALYTIFKQTCLMPKYNQQSLFSSGPNAGGCSPLLRPSSYAKRKSLIELLINDGCEKNYVGNYLLNLSSNSEDFDEDKLINDLSCAGEVTIVGRGWAPF